MTAPISLSDEASFSDELMRSQAPRRELSATAVLTRALSAGDEEAFRSFHSQYFDRLFRYHLVLARGDETSARDALQDTLTRVARKPKRFECADAFWSWLALLARCAAIDGARRNKRHWALLKSYAAGCLRRPAEDHHEELDLHQLLEQCLDSLDPVDRALLEAKYFSGATVRTLAEAERTTEKAMESRLARLRAELRKQLIVSLRHERSS